MSLYRKYRPQAFADVIGQDHVVTTLENAVTQGKLAHAYLFAGSRGTGKTSVARILAKVMLTHGVTDEAVKKQIITGVEDGSLVDLVEIDAASNRGIDDIRNLVEKIQFSPVAAGAKVYIIDEVHMLTREAFNALLKTLEEPPSYAFFILATTELQKIPATIQSRCQRFTFRQIREEDIIRGLQGIVDQEHIQIDRTALRSIARHAQGGMRDAISLLDQLRSLEKISPEDVRERIGESGHEHVDSVFEAIAANDRQALLDIVSTLEEAGIPLDTFVRQLLGDVRNRLHHAVDESHSTADLARMLAILLDAIRDIRIAPVPGLVLETALLTLCGADFLAAPAPVARTEAKPELKPEPRTEAKPEPKKALLKETLNAPVHASEPPPARKEKEAAPVAATIEAPELSIDEVHRQWPTVLRDVTPPSVKMSLKNGRVHSVKGSTILLSFTSGFHRDKVAPTDASRRVEEVLEKVFHRPVRIECVLEEERRGAPAADTNLVNLAEAASEVF